MNSSGNEPLPPWWIRCCCHLWHGLLWVWSVLILGISINVGSSWLVASSFPLAKTPLGWLIDHPTLTLAVGGSLIVITALAGGVTAGHRRFSPFSSSLTQEQQNRQRFLAKLQSRYTDLLEQSLQGAIQIALLFHTTPGAVQNMTRQRLRQAASPGQELPPGTSILDVYDQAGGDLLILGTPGAGKTIQLLNLAVALRERAACDEQHPLPIIINLSTWANHERPLEEWLSEEAAVCYDVPRSPLAHWMRQDQFLPLLDGLDEVPENARSACINAINTFRETHLVSLVVCSRFHEYHTATLHSQLTLQNAVVVQPLGAEQVDAYFKAGGKALTGIRSLLRKDAILRELVSTPLMLLVVTLAYHGISTQALTRQGTLEEQRLYIFEHYIQRQLETQGAATRSFSQDTHHWLSWLARQMRAHNQTTFYLEHLQPDWLPKKISNGWYERLAVKGTGIIIGMLLSLFVDTLFTFIFHTNNYSIDPVYYFLPHKIWFGLMGGLVGGLISGSNTTGFQIRGILRILRQQWRSLGLLGLGTGVAVGGTTVVIFAFWVYPSNYPWLNYGICTGLCGLVLTVVILSGKQAAAQSPSNGSSQHWWYMILPQELCLDHLLLGAVVGFLFGLSQGLCSTVTYELTVGFRYAASLFHLDPLEAVKDFLQYALGTGLGDGLNVGLSFGIFGTFLSLLLLKMKRTIELVEVIGWSGKHLGYSLMSKQHLKVSVRILLLIFLFVGTSTGFNVGMTSQFFRGVWNGLIYGLISGSTLGLSVGITYWLLFGLWAGLSRERIDDHLRTKPNQGIKRSIQSALLVGLFTGIFCFLAGILNTILSFSIHDYLASILFSVMGGSMTYGGLRAGWILGLRDGIVIGCTGFLLGGLLTGGIASLRHLLLRLQLRHLRVVPRHYVRFLDDSTRRVLLYKDGGGYRFIHRLFLDYFADLEAEPSPALQAVQGTAMAQEQTTEITTLPPTI